MKMPQEGRWSWSHHIMGIRFILSASSIWTVTTTDRVLGWGDGWMNEWYDETGWGRCWWPWWCYRVWWWLIATNVKNEKIIIITHNTHTRSIKQQDAFIRPFCGMSILQWDGLYHQWVDKGQWSRRHRTQRWQRERTLWWFGSNQDISHPWRMS